MRAINKLNASAHLRSRIKRSINNKSVCVSYEHTRLYEILSSAAAAVANIA